MTRLTDEQLKDLIAKAEIATTEKHSSTCPECTLDWRNYRHRYGCSIKDGADRYKQIVTETPDTIKSLATELLELRESDRRKNEALISAKEGVKHFVKRLIELNKDIHGDLYGCDCEGGCSCKPKLWCDLEDLGYHGLGCEIVIDDALGEKDAG